MSAIKHVHSSQQMRPQCAQRSRVSISVIRTGGPAGSGSPVDPPAIVALQDEYPRARPSARLAALVLKVMTMLISSHICRLGDCEHTCVSLEVPLGPSTHPAAFCEGRSQAHRESFGLARLGCGRSVSNRRHLSGLHPRGRPVSRPRPPKL